MAEQSCEQCQGGDSGEGRIDEWLLPVECFDGAAMEAIMSSNLVFDHFGKSSETVRSRSLRRRFRRFSGSPSTNCPLSALLPRSNQ